MYYKNTASQKFIVYAYTPADGKPKTGDSANITAYVSKDWGAVTVLGDTSATEMDATNAPGYYLFDATQGETNADVLMVSGKSSTSGVYVLGAPAVILTMPTTGVLSPATLGRTLVVDASGLADANAVKVGPSGSGTAQTARDIGASVLLSAGTGTGQLDFTSGVVKANVTQFGGTNATSSGGRPEVNTTHVGGTSQTARDLGASVLLSNGTGTGQVKLSSGYVAPDWGDVGNPTTILALTNTTISVAQDVAHVTSTVASVTGNVGGNVVGSVGSVTGAVGSVTGNVGGNVTGSVGSVVGAVGSVTGAVGSVTGAVGSVTGNVGGNVTGSVGSLATQAKADVNAEVVDCLNVDTYAEPGQEAPAATNTLAKKIGYLFKAFRNRRTQTATTLKLYNDDAVTVDQKATTSDDGTTAEVGEIGSGP